MINFSSILHDDMFNMFNSSSIISFTIEELNVKFILGEYNDKTDNLF